MSYGENLICKFEDTHYWNWGTSYTCTVTSLENGNNDKVITGYTGGHCRSSDNDVKKIYISRTKAKYIPAKIGKLFNLTSFYFGSSQLLAIKSQDFEYMQDLKHLELGWNQITTVPANAFSNLRKLEYLSLYINHIEELPIGVFSKNVNLKEVWLTHNKIKFLGNGIFDGLTQLNKLDLENNHCVSKVYSGLVELKNDMVTMCKDSPSTLLQNLLNSECEAKIQEVQRSLCSNCVYQAERFEKY